MIFKIVLLFLIAMAILAMFGKLRVPGQKHLEDRKCIKCGRYRLGRGPCECTKGRD